MRYQTKTNDRLDTLCQQYYGRVDVVPQVLEANPVLSDYPALLPAGLVIELPSVTPKRSDNTEVKLWD